MCTPGMKSATGLHHPVHPGEYQAGVGTARSWLAMQTAYDLAAETAASVPKVRRLDEVA